MKQAVCPGTAHCRMVPSLALVIFPHPLHVCRERQNWFALEEREADPAHPVEYLQRNGAQSMPFYGDISFPMKANSLETPCHS